jgi:hypothetical protein
MYRRYTPKQLEILANEVKKREEMKNIDHPILDRP